MAARSPKCAPTTSPRCRPRASSTAPAHQNMVHEFTWAARTRRARITANVARMALLLAGCLRPSRRDADRLCASGLDVGAAARAIRAGEIDLAIAGGVESLSRAPFVMGRRPRRSSERGNPRPTSAGAHQPPDEAAYGVDSMPETGENVAQDFRSAAPTRTRLPTARNSGRRRLPRRPPRREHRARDCSWRKGSRHNRFNRRASARRYHVGRARQNSARSSARTAPSPPATPLAVNDWRGRDDPRIRQGGRGKQLDAGRAHSWHGERRRAAAHHGIGPVPAVTKLCERPRPETRDFGVLS